MRILALDVGERRIGLAISDELRLTAQGLPTLNRTKPSSDLKHIEHLVKEYDAKMIVVGLPRNMNGSMGVQANIVLAFIEDLKRKIPDTPVIPWDERLTTRAAERVLLEADLSRSRRKKKIDQVAAILILQNYLDSLASSRGSLSNIEV
jgi:putative holliday junction resolvase